jgi:hypothetical protein
MRDSVHEKLNIFYGHEIPGYILNAGKTFIIIRVGDECFKNRKVKITIEDVAEYYLTQARNMTSGCRVLADLIGDWRPIDMMTRECLEWFKVVNIEAMSRSARRRGLIPRF